MVGKYDVYYEDRIVGQADVRLQGLYYGISCRCVMNDLDLYKIEVRCADQSFLLGTLIPTGRNFTLERKVSKKQFPNGKPVFYAINRSEERFVPIYDDKPFPYLGALRTARLEFQKGQPGIFLKEDESKLDYRMSNSKPTGQ